MAIFRMNDTRDALTLHEFPSESNINVGIGVDTATEKLHVGGRIKANILIDGDLTVENAASTLTVATIDTTGEAIFNGLLKVRAMFYPARQLPGERFAASTRAPLVRNGVNATLNGTNFNMTVTDGVVSAVSAV